ncbi:unnamed protein product, partial [marine sediment metagenome]
MKKKEEANLAPGNRARSYLQFMLPLPSLLWEPC